MGWMSEIKQKIRQARPRLRDVSPLGASIVIGFGIMNVILGFGLFTLRARTMNLLVINDLMTYQFWGVIFGLLGVAMLLAYWINSWTRLRQALIVGVFLKSWWLAALSIRLLTGDYDNILLISIWGLLTYIQLATFIYIIPPQKSKEAQT